MDPTAVTVIGRRIGRAIASGVLGGALALVASTGAADEVRYVVRPGDNPWNLTERFLRSVDDWPRLQRFNAITEPERMQPGTVLRIPVAWLRGAAASTLVVATHGDVRRSEAGPLRFEAVEGASSLATGTIVRTGSDGHATLQFVDGSRVRLLPDSELAIRRSATLPLGAGTIVELDLIRGAIENVVRPRAGPGGRFEIRTPAAVAAVRGTEFRVGADEGSARSEVEGGVVRFGNRRGDRDLGAGFGTIATPGESPRPPIALLQPPDLGALPRVVERVPLDLPFTSMVAASGYRVQFAPDAADATVEASELARGARVRVPDLPDGRYVVRVRAIDRDGLEGLDAQRPLTIHARPEPPVLVEPPPDGQTTAERPTLRWAEAANAREFHVQLSRDPPSFDQPFAQATAPGGTFQAGDALEPGLYHWRVASIDANASEGPFSDPQRFRRVIPAPGIEPPDQSGDTLTLRWRAAGDGARYALQLGRDDGFAQPLIDETLDEARYAMKRPEPGTYHLRVRAIAADGFAGPWGAPQRIVVADDRPNYWPLLLLLLIPLFF